MKYPLTAALAFVLAGFSTGAFAQSANQPQPPDAPPGGQTAPMSAPAHPHHANAFMQAYRSITLSDQQQAQVSSIMSNYRTNNQGVTDPQTRRANRRQLMSDLLGVLTPDQRTQFNQNLAQLRSQMRAGQGMPGPGGMPPQQPQGASPS